MEDKKINRRSFFKKAASAALPILAAVTVPTLLTSCEIDEPYLNPEDFIQKPSTGCNGCKGGCGGGCTSNCGVACGSACKGSCGGQCSTACTSTCRGACKVGSYFK